MDQYQNLMDMDVDVPDLTPNLYSGLRPTNSEPVPLALCLRILADVIEHYDPHRAASLPDYFPQFGVAVGNKAVLSMIGTELQRAAFDKDPFIGLNIQKCVANSKPAYSKWFYKRQHEADFMTTARRIRPAPSGYRPHDIDNLQHVENARPVPVTPTWLTSCPRLSITSTTGHTTVTGAGKLQSLILWKKTKRHARC